MSPLKPFLPLESIQVNGTLASVESNERKLDWCSKAAASWMPAERRKHMVGDHRAGDCSSIPRENQRLRRKEITWFKTVPQTTKAAGRHEPSQGMFGHNAIWSGTRTSRWGQSNTPTWTMGWQASKYPPPPVPRPSESWSSCGCRWRPLFWNVLIAIEHQSSWTFFPICLSPPFFKDLFSRWEREWAVLELGVLPPTKSWATSLWANNTVPCRGTGAGGRSKVEVDTGDPFLRNVMLLRSCC